MDEFIENFKEFRQFLNAESTEWMFSKMLGKDAESVLKVIKDRFNELGLNDAF